MSIPRGLFLSHRGSRCGVWQFGFRLHRSLAMAGGIDWTYAECGGIEEFEAVAEACQPDVILANFHPHTLPWARNGLRFKNAVSFSTFHEASRMSVGALQEHPFDVLLCPDPTFRPWDPRAVSVPRFIPPGVADPGPAPEIFTVGTFGFATPGKGFDRLCALVNDQFETARIRINIPPHDDPAIVPLLQTTHIIAACQLAIFKPGIKLEITHEFWDEEGLLRFLSENTINAFVYDDSPGRGISSCIDYALAAGRPVAVSRSALFRHVVGINPSICVEERGLAAIAASGTAPLSHHRTAYAEATAGEAWTRAILESLASRRLAEATPDRRGFNKLLDDSARAAYGEAVDDLHRLAPDIMTRKIERANIQQAFALDTARRVAAEYPEPRILAVGAFEDSAVASLKALGYRLDEIDPQVNGLDLEAFYRKRTTGTAYEVIVCVSVLEHVKDDDTFVRQVADLLAPGGTAVFTVDYSRQYPDTQACPAADYRLYTTEDLRQRLMGAIPDCVLLDPPSWNAGVEDFEYENVRYAFAGWVFRRLPEQTARYASEDMLRLGGPPWKALLDDARAQAATLEASLNEATLRAEQTLAELSLAEQATARAEALAHQALQGKQAAEAEAAIAHARWRALVHDLQPDDAPISLRAVLPLARGLRGLRRALLSDAVHAAPAEQLAPASVPNTPPPPATSPAAGHAVRATPRFRPLRRVARLAYAPIRPVVRPLMWRLRSFLMGPTLIEIGRVQAELRSLEGRQVSCAFTQHQPAIPPTDMMAEAELRRLGQTLDDAITTLAMEAGRRLRPGAEEPANRGPGA